MPVYLSSTGNVSFCPGFFVKVDRDRRHLKGNFLSGNHQVCWMANLGINVAMLEPNRFEGTTFALGISGLCFSPLKSAQLLLNPDFMDRFSSTCWTMIRHHNVFYTKQEPLPTSPYHNRCYAIKKKRHEGRWLSPQGSAITPSHLLNFLQGTNQAHVSPHECRQKPWAFKCAFNCVGSGSVVK